MIRTVFVISAICAGLAIGGIPAAQAHSAKQCEKQIKSYKGLCKFSPTAFIFGMCVTKETLKACKDSKKHKKTFH